MLFSTLRTSAGSAPAFRRIHRTEAPGGLPYLAVPSPRRFGQGAAERPCTPALAVARDRNTTGKARRGVGTCRGRALSGRWLLCPNGARARSRGWSDAAPSVAEPVVIVGQTRIAPKGRTRCSDDLPTRAHRASLAPTAPRVRAARLARSQCQAAVWSEGGVCCAGRTQRGGAPHSGQTSPGARPVRS